MLLSTFLLVSFEGQVFNLMKSCFLLCFVLPTYVFGVISKKALCHSRPQRFIPLFSSKHFIVLALTFKPMLHLEQIFVCGVRNGSNSMLLHVNI